MRKITSLLLLLLCAVTVLSARENKYDRGIVMKTFIPKGQWMVGATFSYSEHVDENFEFMSLLKDIDSEGYTFKVTPLVSYFIRDNISIGGRLAYSRSYTKLDNLSLSLGDDISLDINEWNDKSNTYSAAFFIRTYLNLGDSKRFGLFNEARLLYGFSKSTSSSDLGSGLSGVHQLKHNLNIGIAPGITCFVNDFTAVEASIAVAGLNFNWYDQKKDQVYDGKRTSSSANFKINDWLTIQARGNMDYWADKLRQKFYASTATALCGANGRYIEMDYQETQMYGDVMAMFKKTWGDFTLDAAIGGSINDRIRNSTRYDSKNASLKFANVFNIANIIMNSSASIDQKIDEHRQLQSIFGTAQIGYKEKLFLDLTARNDWASTLAYTEHEKAGFAYPSVGLSILLDKWVKLPEWISFAKLRGAYSKVGNDIPVFVTNSTSHIGAGGEIQANDAAPFKDMEPEMTHAMEFGTEWRFFQHRLGINLTYYRTNTYNQFFKLPALAGDKYAFRYVNAGNIQNQGWEVTLNGTPMLTSDFTWKTSINFSANKNKIVKLHDELKELVYGPTSFSSSYAMKLVKGGSIGDIYGKAFVRDAAGNIVYETEGDYKGLPLVEGDGNTVKVGNANPVFMMGWDHTFSYKGFSLYFLLDWRYGGKVLSQTQAEMDLYGVSEITADARDRGYVMLEGQQIDNVKGFYKNVVGGRAGVTEYYMYDATNLRLREVSLSYNFSKKWIQKTKVLKDVQLSFVARNLCFLYKKAPFDPDLVLSTGNDNQGIEVFGMPTTRSLGFTLKCEF